MSRSTLSLYQLDRGALKALSSEVEGVLGDNDRSALARILGVDELALGSRERLVDHFLVADGELHAALRRAAARRALTKKFSSESPALEGRLRAFDALRDDPTAAAAVDRLLNPKRMPWYLRRAGTTCGWLDGAQRETLCVRLDRLRSSLTPELRAFADGLAAIEGDAIAHDGL